MSFDAAILDHHVAPLRPFLDAPDVTELVINRPCEVGIEGRRGWSWEQDERLSAEWLETLSTAMANYTRQRVDPTSPICSTSLPRSEEHTSELQSLMRISYAVFCLKKKKKKQYKKQTENSKN